MKSRKKISPSRIRNANDKFRRTLDPALGGCAISPKVKNLPPFMREAILRGICDTPAIADSIHSHGHLEAFGTIFIWFIFPVKRLPSGADQWVCEELSDDPSDERKTWRHMTISALEEGGNAEGYYHAAI